MRRMTTWPAAMLGLTLAGCALPSHRQAPSRPLRERVWPCPCQVEELNTLVAARPGLVVSRDPDHATRSFHPGAAHVYRIYDPGLDPIAGNQCAYDAAGALIRSGPAAGTPDLYSPERNPMAHFWHDVQPFLRLGWQAYHEAGWGPISDPSCLTPSSQCLPPEYPGPHLELIP